MDQNYNKIPCFLKMKIKTTNKIHGISKQNMWFSTTSTYISFYSSQNYVSKFYFIFLEPPFLGTPKSPHHDSKQQEFKIQTNKVP
jgi:hypothetical protein